MHAHTHTHIHTHTHKRNNYIDTSAGLHAGLDNALTVRRLPGQVLRYDGEEYMCGRENGSESVSQGLVG